MPGLFYEPISRKTFLKTTAWMAGAGLFGQFAGEAGADDEPANEAHVALLSDTHIPADAANEYRGFRPVDNLRQVVPQVVATRPTAVIVNGDAARLEGAREDYAALKELLTPVAQQAPVTIGLGNHDDRGNFFREFPRPRDGTARPGDRHVAVLECGPVRFIVLDSLLYVNRVAGLLGKAQRAWLAGYLETSDDRPHVLLVHHTLGDGDGDLLDVDRLFGIIGRCPKVKALCYGHSHRYAHERRGHIHLINLPAVGYNFADTEPVGWIDARFTKTGVSMVLRAIGGNKDGDSKTTTLDWA